MKKILLATTFFWAGLLSIVGQTKNLNLQNCLIVSKIDNQQDRFSLEVTLSEILTSCNIKNAVSINLLKHGANVEALVSDSLSNSLIAKGINTFMLVSIRGYDRKFKVSKTKMTFNEDLALSNLFTLYKEGITSITLEFHFYRNGIQVGSDLIKIGGIDSREEVLKKLRKKLPKRIRKFWK